MDSELKALRKAQQAMDRVHAEAMLIPKAKDDDDWEPEQQQGMTKEAEEWKAVLERIDMIEERLSNASHLSSSIW